MGKIKLVLEVARKYLGRPYVWGGDDPEGIDCSGFCLEVLKSVGLFPPSGDTTADGLMNYGFLEVDMDVEALQPGQLVFWGANGKATHVEMVYTITYDAEVFTIGASGGGSGTRAGDRYEYRRTNTPNVDLNALGQEGWELVTVVDAQMIFKRKLESRAARDNAYVKIRPMRGGVIAARDPFAQYRGNFNRY